MACTMNGNTPKLVTNIISWRLLHVMKAGDAITRRPPDAACVVCLTDTSRLDDLKNGAKMFFVFRKI
jgi:hypothetical protein